MAEGLRMEKKNVFEKFFGEIVKPEPVPDDAAVALLTNITLTWSALINVTELLKILIQGF